jgi:alkylation response protein AidB-like acyl-CoA dehydrogenase
MNLQLTEEQELVIAMVRRFVRDEILPLEYDLDPDADELDQADRARLIEKTKEMGLYGLDIPPAFGGPDIDLVTRTLMAG